MLCRAANTLPNRKITCIQRRHATTVIMKTFNQNYSTFPASSSSEQLHNCKVHRHIHRIRRIQFRCELQYNYRVNFTLDPVDQMKSNSCNFVAPISSIGLEAMADGYGYSLKILLPVQLTGNRKLATIIFCGFFKIPHGGYKMAWVFFWSIGPKEKLSPLFESSNPS